MATQIRAAHTSKAPRARAETPAKVLPKRLPRRAVRVSEERLDKATRVRLADELSAALKRKPACEAKLAAALRGLAPHSPALREAMAEATQLLVRRGSFDRELYACCIRALSEAGAKAVPALLRTALAADDAGGSATLGAAAFCLDPSLAGALVKLASSPRAHVAFGAEIARVRRLESSGAHLASLAPMIKESHRIALCGEFFLPLVRSAPLPLHIGPGLAVLRGAERHLGRWLVLAELATKAGDPGPLAEATANAQLGPTSAKAAWTFVAWALMRARRAAFATTDSVPEPNARPTVELVSRLSDRPSAERDMTFLFRLAEAAVPAAQPMLEGLVKGAIADEASVRAALYLARDYGQSSMRDALVACATDPTREALRGLAVAALWDTADVTARQVARDISAEMASSRVLANVAWGALVRAAAQMSDDVNTGAAMAARVLDEATFRWVQCGWLE